jgi:hypothetical protein
MAVKSDPFAFLPSSEDAALKYYWWFFLLFALLGSSILQMVLRMFQEGSFEFQNTLEKVADTIPSQVSSNWTNWIILKATVRFYLLLGSTMTTCSLKTVLADNGYSFQTMNKRSSILSLIFYSYRRF